MLLDCQVPLLCLLDIWALYLEASIAAFDLDVKVFASQIRWRFKGNLLSRFPHYLNRSLIQVEVQHTFLFHLAVLFLLKVAQNAVFDRHVTSLPALKECRAVLEAGSFFDLWLFANDSKSLFGKSSYGAEPSVSGNQLLDICILHHHWKLLMWCRTWRHHQELRYNGIQSFRLFNHY